MQISSTFILKIFLAIIIAIFLLFSISLDTITTTNAIIIHNQEINSSIITNINNLIIKGYASISRGNFSQAIMFFDKILDIEPNNFIALNGKAAALIEIGNYSQAIGYSDKVLKLEPNFTGALINKGTALESLGNHSQAIEYFNKALNLEPNNIKALNGRHTALEKLIRK
jgi:tetratricopeptide (TPR) repeat protein